LGTRRLAELQPNRRQHPHHGHSHPGPNPAPLPRIRAIGKCAGKQSCPGTMRADDRPSNSRLGELNVPAATFAGALQISGRLWHGFPPF
jgi:hypothetical protein